MAANLCEGGRMLAQRLHLPDEVARALGQFTERWDGKGFPGEVEGEEISRPLRIVRVAHDLVAIAHGRDLAAAVAALSRRRGRGYDPQVVDAALAEPESLMLAADLPDAWERALAAEPAPLATISRAGLASVARAFGEFVDVKLSFLHGHSARVAELAARGAEGLGCSRTEVADVRTAGLLPRHRPCLGAERDLGATRTAEHRRVGAGSPPSLLHGARPGAGRRARVVRRCSPARTTSASTAPAITAGRRPRSSPWSAPAGGGRCL